MSLIWIRLLRAAKVYQSRALQALRRETIDSVRDDVGRFPTFDEDTFRVGAEHVQLEDQRRQGGSG